MPSAPGILNSVQRLKATMEGGQIPYAPVSLGEDLRRASTSSGSAFAALLDRSRNYSVSSQTITEEGSFDVELLHRMAPRGSLDSLTWTSVCSIEDFVTEADPQPGPETPVPVLTPAPATPPPPSSELEPESEEGNALRNGRPEGKFPLCPNGRCQHTNSWHRIRSKRGTQYYECTKCGVHWCTRKGAQSHDEES